MQHHPCRQAGRQAFTTATGLMSPCPCDGASGKQLKRPVSQHKHTNAKALAMKVGEIFSCSLVHVCCLAAQDETTGIVMCWHTLLQQVRMP